MNFNGVNAKAYFWAATALYFLRKVAYFLGGREMLKMVTHQWCAKYGTENSNVL